ncbi:lysophospholipid acyltransferase family protein [Rummeliibacillus sp. TYF005]|uniref:lysophospholipid acyltransferase family protein n=1 Tax=Rummeliibacillus sp. TYF005 TaxID=2058214 RepID=UPI002697CE0B
MYRFAGLFVVKLLGLFNKLKVYNKNNLPAEGGYVIACNIGWIDILNLGVSIYPKPIHFMAKKQLFDHKPLGWFKTKRNAFPIDCENPGPSAVKVPIVPAAYKDQTHQNRSLHVKSVI